MNKKQISTVFEYICVILVLFAGLGGCGYCMYTGISNRPKYEYHLTVVDEDKNIVMDGKYTDPVIVRAEWNNTIKVVIKSDTYFFPSIYLITVKQRLMEGDNK